MFASVKSKFIPFVCFTCKKAFSRKTPENSDISATNGHAESYKCPKCGSKLYNLGSREPPPETSRN